MVMFSELRRFRVRDRRGAQVALRDVAVDLSAPDFPPVTRLLFHKAREGRKTLPWQSVTEIDYRHRLLRVEDLSKAEPLDDEPKKPLVLLDRDILDALVLDLSRRHSMRANDLWL